jgi:hypothetical protein
MMNHPEEDAERIMLVPANPTWFGKRPDRAVPLTDVAVRGWIRSGTLLPPEGNPAAERRGAILAGCGAAIFLCFLALMISAPMWAGK